MTGRRSQPRFAVSSPWEGVMRVLRNVVVDRTSRDELMAVSHAPGVSGEVMTLDLIGGGVAMALRVRVLNSRPIIMDGAVRHRLTLALLSSVAVDGPAEVSPPLATGLVVEAL